MKELNVVDWGFATAVRPKDKADEIGHERRGRLEQPNCLVTDLTSRAVAARARND